LVAGRPGDSVSLVTQARRLPASEGGCTLPAAGAGRWLNRLGQPRTAGRRDANRFRWAALPILPPTTARWQQLRERRCSARLRIDDWSQDGLAKGGVTARDSSLNIMLTLSPRLAARRAGPWPQAARRAGPRPQAARLATVAGPQESLEFVVLNANASHFRRFRKRRGFFSCRRTL
jgi:hypothetical protein